MKHKGIVLNQRFFTATGKSGSLGLGYHNNETIRSLIEIFLKE